LSPQVWIVSYHIRNVPVLSTIEMSPGCGFMQPRKRGHVPWRKSLFSRDDSQLEEDCGVGSGKGRGGRGSAPSLAQRCRAFNSRKPIRGSPYADRDSESRFLRLGFPAPVRGSWLAPSAGLAVPVAAADCYNAPPSPH